MPQERIAAGEPAEPEERWIYVAAIAAVGLSSETATKEWPANVSHHVDVGWASFTGARRD